MAARMEDEDDDCFVTIGAAFDIPEEETSTKKKFDKHEQVAVDSRGRRRFHGAFTGGFSAGYFNSVGTKEGWSPSIFKSSRSSRAEKENSSQRPEDFMDDEDFGEYGIAPKTFVTKDDFTPTEKELSQRKRTIGQGVREGVIRSAVPGGIPLDDLILPSKLSMGIQLLRKMGWKEGHGVGDKLKKSVETDSVQPGKKVYGCSLPSPTNDKVDTDISISNMQMLLAPKDVQPINFTPKDNHHGIGYSGIDPASGMFLGAGSLAETFKPSGSEKRGIKGQAFGVGALEEDDADIYSRDDMSHYDFAMTSEQDAFRKANHGWSGPPQKDKVKDTIPGFKKASRPTAINKVFRPPLLPANFNALHKLSGTSSNQAPTKPRPDLKDGRHFLSSNDRAVILGEKMPKKPCESVFEIISEEDKSRMKQAKTNEIFGNRSEPKPGLIEPEIPRKPSRWDNKTKTSISFVGSGGAAESSGFKPFTSNPEKQERYDTFMAAKKLGRDGDLHYDSSMTEWEKEREKEEFARASILFRPMSTLIASRFTRATHPIDSKEGDKKNVDDQEEIPDCKKAAAMGLFGKLTRQTMEWHPSSVLCKRFNIPDPYPESRMTGVPGRQRKKVSDWVPELSIESSQQDSIDITEDHVGSEPDTSIGVGVVKRQQEQADEDMMPLKEPIKPSQKSSITIGPLSYLNDSGESKDIKVDFSAKNQTEDKQADDLMKKPSMDLFKAIFADSDSSSEDEEEIDSTEKNLDENSKEKQENRAETSKLEEAFGDQKIQDQLSTSSLYTDSSSTCLRPLDAAMNTSASKPLLNTSSSFTDNTSAGLRLDAAINTSASKPALSGEDKTFASRNATQEVKNQVRNTSQLTEGIAVFESRVVDKPQTRERKASSRDDRDNERSYGPALPGAHPSRNDKQKDRPSHQYSEKHASKRVVKERDIDVSDDSAKKNKRSDFRYHESSDLRGDDFKRRDLDEHSVKSDKSRVKKKDKKKHKKNKKKKHKKHSQKKEKTKRHLSEESSSSEWTDSEDEHLKISSSKGKEDEVEVYKNKSAREEHRVDRSSKRGDNADIHRKERSVIINERKQLQNDTNVKKERDKRKKEKNNYSTELPSVVGSSQDLKSSKNDSNSKTENNPTRTTEKESAPSTKELIEKMRKQGMKIKRMSAADFM